VAALKCFMPLAHSTFSNNGHNYLLMFDVPGELQLQNIYQKDSVFSSMSKNRTTLNIFGAT
jgi:hypothetical protein